MPPRLVPRSAVPAVRFALRRVTGAGFTAAGVFFGMYAVAEVRENATPTPELSKRSAGVAASRPGGDSGASASAAYDLGKLSDEEYEFLAEAVNISLPEPS